MAGVSQGDSVSTVAGEGYSWNSVSADGSGVSLVTGTVFDPSDLFFYGEQGAWYDPSDLSTMFQDSAGTTPVTADGQPVGKILDKSGNGNHATQATAASRPVLQIDGNGKYYLDGDGVDDVYPVAATWVSGAQGYSSFVGARINSAIQSSCILNVDVLTYRTGQLLRVTALSFNNLVFDTTGNPYTTTPPGTLTTTSNYVLSQQTSTSSTSCSINGVVAGSAAIGGTLQTSSGQMNIMGGLTMRAYSIIHLSRPMTTQEITDTETWVNGKTQAY